MFRRLPLSASVCAVFALALGCVGNGDEGPNDEQLETTEQALTSSTLQFASYYLKNVPTGDGRTQWTTVVVNNPNPTPATITLTIRRNDGSGTLGTVTKTIPARGWYNSYGDAAWLGVTETDTVNHRTNGWVELTSNVPVVATNRALVRNGTTFDAQPSLMNDEPFLKSTSTRLLSPLFVRNWPSGNTGVTQWTDITVNNPNAAPANITVRIHKHDGSGVHATLNRTVPAKGAWSSYGEAGWLAIGPTDANLGGAVGWIEVLSDAPVVASSRLAQRSGNTYNAAPVLVDDTPFEAQGSTALRAPQFSKGAPAGGNITQWSQPIIVNPNPTPTTINVVVHKNDGTLPDLASFSKTIPAMGWWNAYNDASWTGATGSQGWTEISASQPVFGMNRVTFRDGNTASSPITLVDDEPFAQTTSGQLFASTYLKKWPSTPGFTQWTDLVVDNPSSASPVTITVRIHKTDGSGDLAFFTRQIPARGAWRSSTDADWLAIPNSDAANGRSSGWVEITSPAPVIALNRTNLRSGDTATSPITLFEDTLLENSIGSACDPSGPGVFCARSTVETVNQFKELMIVDPQVVTDPRASSVVNGHWSFRWLMEQMVAPGADPSDFVTNWINQGFAAGTVNGFPVQDRANVRALINSWPKIPGTSKIDLAQSPFKLLAIVNRVDLASGNGAGEARFVFGLNQGGSGEPMTVIFEYKLPASASRQVWAQRFHALGALPFGADYNARLQMITDEYARRGANPAGVNGSALGQLRTNELLDPFFSPWQLREFNLVSGSPAALKITTTKQTPNGSFNNGSQQLASYLSSNAQAILAGTAVVPASMLGGESNADLVWTMPGASDQVLHAFAKQTCNGCHAAEVPVIDGFYHVSPMSSGGVDGKGRLSPFLLDTDLPLREDFLQATLCNGNCPGVGPVQTTANRVH